MKTEVNINTDILTWAIARAGYDFQEFSIKIPKVIDWIEGTKKPTIKQLEVFSKKVHIPLGYLFLSKPPVENTPITYFRNNRITNKISLNVYDTIQLMLQRQNWLKEYLRENDFQKLDFVGTFRNKNEIEAIVLNIRKVLGLEENWSAYYKNWEEALKALVEKIEDIGIITVFNGVVENNTRRQINVEECRGFVLVDENAPFMFVNNADSPSAQMFTIVHELAHIWTGHSAGFDFRKLQPANDPVEQLCDKVAAEFLVPAKLLDEIWNNFSEINKYAKHFKVSEIVIARRALDLGKITKSEFFIYYDEYRKRELNISKSKSSGGNFYATAAKRLSRNYARHINKAVKSGQLLYRDAYKLTGMKGDTFHKFFKKQMN